MTRRVQLWRRLGKFMLAFGMVALAAASFAQFQVSRRSGWTPVTWNLTSGSPLEDQIQAGLNRETAANTNITAQLLHVLAPRLGINQTFAAGADIHKTDAVRVASNTKTFVAAGALILVERGQLSFDAPIGPYLSPATRSILQNAGRNTDVITLRHLLGHSSGIADYGSSRVFQALAYIPTAFGLSWHWTPQDQIWFAANFTPIGQIGGQFDYSDTNYLLAADMIAKATGAPNVGVALETLLNWPAISVRDTFWEYYQPTPPPTRRVRQFRGAIEDTHLDISFDLYGGGGLVMSMADLAFAHRAVVEGVVFANPTATSAFMQQPGTAIGSNGYGLGIVRVIIEDETCWAHGGRWGTMALHCPRIGVTIARSWGQSNAAPDVSDPNGPIVGLVRLAKAKSTQ